ncbi:hypothetical protein [Anaerocolumna sp. MB42-C2]|uniref:hypothetical protein n=1 Tax=Anaerocolumna sp. MB42-C2 TaxID=3070997 RepID=UPI0027DEC5E6|nr:hypothetical protein [Anaerocolumna sp. MB42-C2]WMJ88021.1 hypothetical protein RBU59_00525 [Anaerocolumna sp. MB42-C2]
MDIIDKDFGLRILYENAEQTTYSLDTENSTSRMIRYRLYPGVDIILSDFQERYIWAGEWKLTFLMLHRLCNKESKSSACS